MTLDELVFENKYLSLDKEFYDLSESTPLDEQPEFEHFNKETPEEHKNNMLSCSS